MQSKGLEDDIDEMFGLSSEISKFAAEYFAWDNFEAHKDSPCRVWYNNESEDLTNLSSEAHVDIIWREGLRSNEKRRIQLFDESS